MAYKSYDLMCTNCQHHEERLWDVDREGPLDTKCSACSLQTMRQIWLKGPSFKLHANGSQEDIARMQQSFRERFVKKEMDDVRHKHGVNFDDSLAGAAIERAKEGQ